MKKILALADKFSIRLTARLADKFADELEEEELAPQTLRSGNIPKDVTIPSPPPTDRYPLTDVPYTIPAGEDPASREYRDPQLPPPPRLPNIPPYSGPTPSSVGIDTTSLQSDVLRSYFEEDDGLTYGKFLADNFAHVPGEIINLTIGGTPVGVFKRKEFMGGGAPGSMGRPTENTFFEEVFSNVKNVSISFDEFMEWFAGADPRSAQSVRQMLGK